MLGSPTFRAWVLIASALIACKFEQESPEGEAAPGDSGDEPSSGGHAGARENDGVPGRSGSDAGGSSQPAPGSGGDEGVRGGSDSGAAGSPNNDSAGAGATGDAGAGGAGDPPSECDLGTGCDSDCREESATCTVAPLSFSCEFVAGAGKSAEVACGELATVDTVCCGGCGCVDIKLSFDGRECWQGIPDCPLDLFSNKLFTSSR